MCLVPQLASPQGLLQPDVEKRLTLSQLRAELAVAFPGVAAAAAAAATPPSASDAASKASSAEPSYEPTFAPASYRMNYDE